MRRPRAFMLSACTRRRLSRGAVPAMAAVFAVAGSPGAASAAGFAVSSTTPADGQAQHSVAQVSATYNQAYAASPAPTLAVCSGTLSSCSGGVAGQVLTTDPANKTVIFLPTSTLGPGAYTATTTATSAANAGDTVNQTWHFSVDQTAPVVQSTSPASGAKAKPSVPISATYDEALDHSTSTISLVNSMSIPVLGSTSFSPDSKTIIFTPMSTLSDGDYTASTSVHDVPGNGPTTTSWTFTTDSTAPSNSAKTPASSAAVTSISTVTATYNEHLGSGAISVTGPTGAVAGASALDAPATMVTFTKNPAAVTPDGVYNASATVQDDAGNQTITPWSFWLDTHSATLQSTSPASGADLATAPGTASATYDEPLAGASTIAMTMASGGPPVPVTGSTAISADKLTITFTPAAPLQEGVYTVNVSAQDLASHPATATTWSFTVDKTAPGKTANSPAANTTVQSLTGGTVNATYNEALDPATSTLTLFDDQQHPVAGAMTFASGNTKIVFTPTTALADGAYSATADVKDPAGNHASPFTWSFTIDSAAPVEQSTAPADESTVQSPSSVSATFNEALDPASALEVCPVACDGGLGHTPVAGSTALSSDKKTITFTPQLGTSLAEGDYAAVATVKDPTGNTAAAFTWTFTVDNTAPLQQAVQPTNNSTVTSAAFASATYNEALAPTSTLSICAGSQLSCTSGALPGSASFSGDKKTILFVPSSPLTDGAYTATTAVSDAAGNARTTTWHFTVNDGTGPVLQSTAPVANATVLSPASVTATYDEPLDTTNSNFSFTLTNVDTSSPVLGNPPNGAVSGNTITFTPGSKLATGHYEAIATVQDVEGNQTVTTWDFVVDNSPPVMTAESPTSGATVTAASTVSATYDQALNSAAGQFSFTLTNTGTNQAVTGSPASGSVSGSTITFTPSASLPDGTYQAVANVHDAVGNATTTTWSFTVDTPPALASTSPADASTVQPPSTVSATYDKSLDSTPGNFSFTLTKGGNPVVGNPPNGAISGSTITFTPANPLAPGAYQATATVQDAAGMQTVTAWNFTVDNTAPLLVSTSPSDATAVTAPSTVSATYNEALKPGPSSSITLTNTDTNQPVLGNPPNGAVSGNTISFTPGSSLASGHYHAVATVQDAAGNQTVSSWNFTVDSSAPAMTSESPSSGATVTAPSTVSATYDQALNSAAGQFSFTLTNTGTNQAVTGSPASGSVSGSTITFTPSASLPDGTYQAVATVHDAVGNATTTTWSFTVDTPPALTSTSPVDGSTVQPPSTVSATYDKSLDSTPGNFSFTLTNTGTGNPVVGSPPNGAISGSTITFTPANPLAPGAYQAVATIQDAAGTQTVTAWNFTVDNTKPVLVSTSPANQSTVVNPATVSATYDKALKTATGTFSLIVTNTGTHAAVPGSTSASGSTITFTAAPSALGNPTFDDGTYQAAASVQDTAGNTQSSTWTFTVDNSAPANVSVSPANGSAGSAPQTVTATFNEPLVASGSSIAVDRNGTPVSGTATMSSDKMTLIFTPDNPLTDGAYGAVAIAKNAAGNSGEKDWSFTIDSAGPVNTAKTPTSGSTVASAPTVSAAFNEALNHATSSLTVKNAANTTIAGSTSFSPDSKTITFTPTSTFADGAYTATAAVKDAVGNATTTTWSFTVDNGAPTAPTGLTMTNPVNSSNVGAVVVSGSAEPGSHVSVSVDDATTSTPAVTGATNADGTTGAFSVTVNLSSLRDGALTATASATDGPGNTGPAASAHATKDTAPPTSAVTPASSLTGGITIVFSEPVSGVSSSNVVLRPTDGGSTIGGTLLCRNASAATVACAGSSTRSAVLTPSSALTSGQHYSLVVNPAGATPVTDGAGNAAAASTRNFRGATSLDDAIAGLRSSWRTASSSSAYGSSYATEHLKGARGVFRFTGSSLRWYTLTGPDQGLAGVSIDGHNKGTVNNYAASRHFHVARTFSGLGGGTHTIVITVVGKKGNTRGTGTAVSIDAFRTSTMTSNPAVTYSWARLSATSASGGSYGVGDLAGAAVSFVFRGTSISLVTVTAADQGRAAIYIDGKLRSTVDNYSASRHFGVKRTVGGLSDTVHTLRIVVLGKHRSGAKGSLVAVDRLIVG